MIHTVNITTYRNGKHGRDLAILDLMQLQQLGLAPGTAPVRLLRELWHLSQPQVSRRMTAIADLGIYRVESQCGRYRLIELQEHRIVRRADQRERAERYEALRRQLQAAMQ